MTCKNCGWSVRWPGPLGGCCPLCRQQGAFREAPTFVLWFWLTIIIIILIALAG